MSSQAELAITNSTEKKGDRLDASRPDKLQISQMENTNYKWVECKILGKNILIRSYAAACVSNDYLYVYGGFQMLNGILSDFHKIRMSRDEIRFEWKQVENTSQTINPGPRAKHSLISTKNGLYLIGGLTNASESSNDIYLFDIDKCSWRKVKPEGQLPKLESFGCTLVSQQRIIITCGFNGNKCKLTNQVIEYNIMTNKVTVLYSDNPKQAQDVPIARSGAGCVTDNTNIYFFGGQSKDCRLNDLWMFNLQTLKYSRISDSEQGRPSFRNGHSTTYYESKLYIFGGIHQVTWELDDLHIYDFKTKNWTTLEVDSARKKDSSPSRFQRRESIQKPAQQSPTRKSEKNWYLEPNNGITTVSQFKSIGLDYNSAKNQQEQLSPGSPSKMRDQQKRKLFLQKKNEMLKNFQVPAQEQKKYINIEPTSQAMKNSLDIIGNSNPKFKSNNVKLTEFGKTSTSKFLQPLLNNSNLVVNKRPCARDGHNAVLLGNEIVFFGGDRHQMSFNDLYKLNMLTIKKES